MPDTTPDLREQIQRVLRERCEVEDRQYTDGTGWVLVRDDNAARVVADHLAPVLEALSTREVISLDLIKRQHAEIAHQRESQIAWSLEVDRLQQERAALSSVLRGMARRVGQKREAIRELAAHLPCGWCNGTGIAPEESFGHDGDGAIQVDGDQPCPEGCAKSA